MANSSILFETRFPIIKSLTDCAYKLDETAFPLEWIPEGDYNGVVKELREKMKNYKIQFVYIPKTNAYLLVYLPSLILPSEFNATPFPKTLRGEIYYLNLNKDYVGNGHLYEFNDDGGNVEMWGKDEEQIKQYVKRLRMLFESDETGGMTLGGDATDRVIHGIDAIRLRKQIKRLSSTQLEKSEKLLKKHGFKDATFETTSHYNADRNKSIGEWDIRNANRLDDDFNGYALALSYKYHNEEFEGNPNLISILLYARGFFPERAMLTSDSLKFLEELAQLF